MLAEALAEMGLGERTVMEVAEDPPVEELNGPPRETVDDATDAVVGHAKARFGGTDAIEGNEAEILADLVAESPRGTNADWKYTAETAEWQLSSAAEEFGYQIEFRSLGDEHTVPFRYPLAGT